MADSNKLVAAAERDVDQAITALKKGAQLLKYGRRGKPKFCPFRLSNDESSLLWYSGKDERHIKLTQVLRIIPGQRTAIFQRYPRPEKEYQSFSLICTDRSLDLICKDKDEAEVWFIALKALLSRASARKWTIDPTGDSVSSDSPLSRNRRSSPSITHDGGQVSFEVVPQNGLAKAFSDIVTYTGKTLTQSDLASISLSSVTSTTIIDNNSNNRSSAADTFRISLSSAVSSSSQGSGNEDFDAMGDVFIWGEGIAEGLLGGGTHKSGTSSVDALVPRALESTGALDVHNIACGNRHAVLVTKQGEIYSWGEESGGRLGHGVEADVSDPKLINTLSGMNIELVACGEFHTCAVTFTGDLYTWGDGTHNSGLLGHGSDVSHRIPKKVSGNLEGIRISQISCGPWHTAAVTSEGQLFTFGDGTFGALGHGHISSTSTPREVETLKGHRTIRVSCGIWHTAAVVELVNDSFSSSPSESCSLGTLFTWGDGDKGQLGHGDKESKLVPCCVSALNGESLCQVACGNSFTIALTTAGKVHAMGSNAHGQLGSPAADGKLPICVEGDIANSFVEEIACGSNHVVVLTSKTEVYTWGNGKNGQLGHGDTANRNTPTRVKFLKDKQVKRVICGSNVTAVICINKWVSSTDRTVCTGCQNLFGFRRKRHNCYHCGLVFCKACSSRKASKASLAPSMTKPYRVCDDCFSKLKKSMEVGFGIRIPKAKSVATIHKPSELARKEFANPRLTGSLSQFEMRHSKCDSRVFPMMNGDLQLRDVHLFKTSTSERNSASASFHGSRAASPIMSPASAQSSPILCVTPTEDLQPSSFVDYNSKQSNEILTQEISSLRAQVDRLTSKSEQLETQLEKKDKRLIEVSARADNEAEKCKAAEEVIKTLTVQLKELAEKPAEVGFQRSAITEPMISSTERHSKNVSSTNGHLTKLQLKEMAAKHVEVGYYSNERSAFTEPVISTTERLSRNVSSTNGHLTKLQLNEMAAEVGFQRSDFTESVISNTERNSKSVSSHGNETNETKAIHLASINSNGNLEKATNSNSHKYESNLNVGGESTNRVERGRAEKVIQDEPGVYVTLYTLPMGVNELKRVRFSRKRFTEEEAEKWWAENGAKVCERHNIRAAA